MAIQTLEVKGVPQLKKENSDSVSSEDEVTLETIIVDASSHPLMNVAPFAMRFEFGIHQSTDTSYVSIDHRSKSVQSFPSGGSSWTIYDSFHVKFPRVEISLKIFILKPKSVESAKFPFESVFSYLPIFISHHLRMEPEIAMSAQHYERVLLRIVS